MARTTEAIRAVLGPMTSESTCQALTVAVLRAIREPSERQYEALSATDRPWRELDSQTVWQTYIDAEIAHGRELPGDTEHLMSTEANAERLTAAVEQMDSPEA